ncbi:unnamed protein product [Alternaria alternata]
MAAALPGLALQAFADLWGQQPELAAGLYAVGAVAAAVPRYVPTFEQAKFWCQKPRQSTTHVAESIPVASEALGTVSATFSRNRPPPVVVITRSASPPLASEIILTSKDGMEPEVSDSSAPFNFAYTDSGSPAVRSVTSTESSSFQARPASSATIETSPDVVNKVLGAVPAETPNISSDHIAPKPSIKTSVSLIAASDETAASSSRCPVRWAGTQTSAPLNRSSEPEGESASNSIDADSSASDKEASNCTNMVSTVSPNMSSHGIPTHGNSTPDDPRLSNEATQQTTGIASSSVTSIDSGEFGLKLSRTLFQVVANNLPAMPKSYKQTESPSNDNKDRKPSSKTASSRLPSEQLLSETLDDSPRLGEHRPAFTTSVERQSSEPLHASPLLAESESLSSFKSRHASEESHVAYRVEGEPTASSNYNDFISWVDIVLILVPSILIATSIGLAGNDPLDQDLYATLMATLCTVVVGCLPYLDFCWPTLRYSFLAMYRHSLESISSFMLHLTGFVRQWQETLSGILRKQHADHIIADRVPYAVLIGFLFIALLITINQMITRLPQYAELSQWEANRLRLYKGFVGTIAALIVGWFSDYIQDFILVFTTTVYAAVTATVYLTSHPQQVFECFKGINGGVSLPINHCAIVVKYGALSIAVLLMHIPIVSRGLRAIRARIQERYNRVAHDRPVAPWHPTLGGDRFWLSLTIIVLGAEKVSEVMTEWAVPTLKTGAMVIVTLTLARTFGALGCTQDYIIVLITIFAILIHLPLEIQAPTNGKPASVALVDETPIDEVLAADELFPDVMQADEDLAVEAPPNPPARLAMSAPGSVALPLPSRWWWQPMVDWFYINNAARAAKERAVEEARVVAEQENANFRLQVKLTRQDQPLISIDIEYLQSLRDMTSGTNTTQPPSNEDETQTARKAWNTTQPFRPMYMYTEREYQAALRGEIPAIATSESTLEPPVESVPTPLAQDSAVSVATDLSILASAPPSATASVPAPQTSTILSNTSSLVRADASYPATSSGSLFAPAPTATPDVTQERIASTNEVPAEVDNPDALPILMTSSSGSRPQGDCNHETSTPIATTTTPAVLDTKPSHELAFAPGTGLAEPGMPFMDPGNEQGPSSLPNPTVSAPIIQSAEPSPDASKSLDEDKLADELEHPCTEDRIGYVENAQADGQQQDQQHNERDSDDEGDFSSSGGVTGLDDRSFEEQPIDETEGLDDEALAAAEQLREEMESGAKRNEVITSVQAASDEAAPLVDNCDDNEQTGTKTEQPVERTLMDVDPVIIPSTAEDGFQDEHGNVIDTPMGGVPENGADMLELKVLSANSGDHITMGGTDNKEASDRGGGSSSGEGFHGEIVLDTQINNDVHILDNKLESNNPKDGDGSDDSSDDSSDRSEPHGRLQSSTVGGTTSAAPFSNAGGAIAAAADTTMTDNDEDSEMIDVAIIGAAEIGNAGCNASASAQFNTTELPKAIQAAQSEDGQPNESFTTPSDVEGGQDHNTDDDDDWDSIYASADGHLSSANVPRSSTTRAPPTDPSGTYSPFSNASSGDSGENISPSQQIDDFGTEEFAQTGVAKKDKQMQIDAQRDLDLPLNGYVKLPGIRNQSHDDIRRADDKPGDLTAGIMGIDSNNHDTDYQQTRGIDHDFETAPNTSLGDSQLPTTVDDETNTDTDGLNWTDIRPKTRLVQLWEDRQIVDNPDYPPHRSAGMRPLEETYGQPCQIFREVDMAAYEFFGENHENFQYAQEGVDWFHPEAEGAEPRDESEGEIGEENNAAANEVEGRVDDDLSARVAASKTESNAAFRLDYSDSESTLSNPPDSTDLDTIGANLLMEEMNRKIPVLKNGGRELIDNSALVSEEAYPSKKENSVSASLPDDDGTESHLIITDATREEAARFGCTTDSQILDFMESIDRPEKREGGRFLTPKSRKDRKGNSSGSSTSSAVMFSPVQAPAQQSMPKKRYNGPVSFNLDEGDVQPRLKPAPPMTKNLLEKMADFNSDPVKRAALQDMANKVGDTSKIPSPAWKSPVATNNSPFASKFQGASNSPRLSKSNSTSPSPYPRPSISSGGYDSIRASSLPFDPSKPRPYVPEGFDPSVLDRLNSTNPFRRSSSTNASTPSYLQRDAIVSPTRRLGYRPMRLPEATLSTSDDPLIRYSAHNPLDTSIGVASPPVNPPGYDSLQPAAGMASEISSVGSLSYGQMEPSLQALRQRDLMRRAMVQAIVLANHSSDHNSNHRSNNDRIYVDEGNEDDECCDGNDSYHDDNDGDVPQEEATLIIPRENSQPNDQAGQLRDGE